MQLELGSISASLSCLVYMYISPQEGRTGVFLWYVISSTFYFSWNANLGHCSCLVIWRLWVTREEPQILTDIRDFTTLFYVILRHGFSEWLEWSIESDLGIQFVIWSLHLVICDFASFKQCFQCKKRSLKRVSHFLIFVIRENIFF